MRVQMRDRVAVPMAHMLPGAAVELLDERPRRPVDGSIGWQQRLYGLRVHLAELRAGARPLRPKVNYRGFDYPAAPDNLITITLREAEHWPERNSNLGEWHAAATLIRSMGYHVVVVRETRFAGARFADFADAPQASLDLYYRAALYRAAALNLFVNNGPAWFAVALDAPVMIFKLVVEGLMPTVRASYFAGCGLPPGQQLPAPHQTIVWENDTFASIAGAFQAWHEARAKRSA
jgi:hypothetical protein